MEKIDLKNYKLFLIPLILVIIIILVFFITFLQTPVVVDEPLTPVQENLIESFDARCDFNTSVEQKAITNRDSTLCFCIDEIQRQNTCIQTVANAISYSRAAESLDESYCEKINLVEMKNNCIALVLDSQQQLLKLNPSYYANKKLENGEYDKALEIIELIPTGEKSVINYLNLANIYSERALFEHKEEEYISLALENINKAKIIEPNNPEVYRVEGYVYEIKQDLVAAINSYNISLEKDPSYISSYVGRGHTYSLAGISELALNDFQKAKELDVNKDYIRVYANLCRIQSLRDDLIGESINNCNIALEINSGETSLKTDVLIILSDLYIKTNQLTNAKSAIESASAYSPNDPNVYVAFAKIYNVTEEYNLTEESANKAISLDSKKTVAYAYLSFAQLKQGNFENAIDNANIGLSVIEDDVSLLPGNKPVFKQYLYYVLADTYSNLSDFVNSKKYSDLGDASV